MPQELPLVAKFQAHDWQCSSVDFHPAGNMIASGSWDRTIKIWDVEEKTLLRTIDREDGHTRPVTSVKWHPNGALIASTSADNTTCLWDVSNGQRMRTLKEHFGWVLSCSFAPDRTKLATASWDKTVRLWDPNTGELISTLRGHTKGVWACEFYPVGHTSALLATAGEDATARLWDTRTRKVALTLSGGHVDAVYTVAWSNDGSLIATGSADRTITLWDPKAGKILRLLKGHEDTVKKAVFSPINKYNPNNMLATAGGYSGMVWNPAATANNLVAESKSHDEGKEVECCAISYNGRLLATGGRDGAVCISEFPSMPKQQYFADQDAEAAAEQDSHVAERWRTQQARLVQATNAHEGISGSKMDERSAWLQRLDQREERSEQFKPTQVPRVNNASKLLAKRGFTATGTLERQVHSSDEEDDDSSAAVSVNSMDLQPAGPARRAPSEPAAQDSPLRRVQMLDDAGKAHPMIQAAQRQAPAAAGSVQAPGAKPISDVDSLMHLLRAKTEEPGVAAATSAEPVRPRPKSQAPRPEASVSELLDLSRPKLDLKPRMRTPSQGKRLSGVPSDFEDQ
eukprot:m.57311 g.57311  ORF g.57311 m.57311 type:complete len:570 (-) comp13720_c0_seq1:150-1859(-)